MAHGRFLRAIAECFASLSHSLGVCLSVCVTLLYCIKTVQAGIMKSSLWAATRTPVYHDNFVPLGERLPLE